MKRIALALIGVSALGMGCSAPSDSGKVPVASESIESTSLETPSTTYHHYEESPAGLVDQIRETPIELHTREEVDKPVELARYHSCAKVTYASLGSILSTRGIAANGSSFTIYKAGSAALGVANYPGRVAEALSASTSAMAKQFDIFIAAAGDIQKNLTTSTACPGLTPADATGKFSKDALSCIMGKLATDAHVAVANQAVADAVKGGATQDEGVQIAIAAALEASHTCE